MKDSLAGFARRFYGWVSGLDSIRLLLLGYTSYIVLGWLVLWLPICHQTSGLKSLDHLFMATSAVSTTGLTTISTADSYNFLGELVLLLLIQFGGLGYMTLSSFTMLALVGQLSPLRQRMSSTSLSLPQGFEVRAFLRVIVGFTLVIEILGALALYPVFVRHAAPQPVWQAVFHSVSAFCTAGFGLFNDSFESYRDDVWLNVVITVLSYLGAIGFIVMHDLWKSLRHLKPHVTLTSKVILAGTVWISLIGTVLFALDEPSVKTLPATQRWMASLFQVMTASTTVGFNTIPIGGLSASSMFLLTVVMIIGASPSGTGGGLKTTTFTALWAAMMGVVRRRDTATFLGREIPEHRMRAAVATMMFYVLTLAAGIYALALVEKAPLPDQMFECASALGTVGLSRGITASLTPLGKAIIIALMFLGRVGPVVLGMAFFRRAAAQDAPALKEDVAV
ncbi:MAG TPA: potassium transporter TrkG [Verrucomicrobiae bacterium]